MVITLSHAGRGKGKEQGRREPGAAARRPKVPKGLETKMSGLYREEPLGEGWRVQGRGRVCWDPYL